MTKPARITQADIERVCKAVRAAGIKQAKIVVNLEARIIELILGAGTQAPAVLNEWDNE